MGFMMDRCVHEISGIVHVASPQSWRSYAIALIFIVGRFVLGVTGWEALGVEIAQAIIWSCLALSVVLADVAIHWKEIRAALTVPVRSDAAAATAKSGVSRKQNVFPLTMGEV
jgi:hypothetical protein